MKRTILVVMLALAATRVHATANCDAIEDSEARGCCEQNLPQQSMRQRVRMTVADDKGTIRNLGSDLYWKRFEDGRARARVDLTDPPRQSGTAVLLTERESKGEEAREPEVVLYKPGERRDRLVTVSALSGEMLGTDFSYEDFAHFYGTNPDVIAERLPDDTVDGIPVIVLRTAPRDPEAAFDRGSSYSHVITRFDAERCVPLVTEFFEDDDFMRKRLVASPDSVQTVGERHVPHQVVMHDLEEGSRTILDIEEIEFEPELRDLMFSRSSLKRGR